MFESIKDYDRLFTLHNMIESNFDPNCNADSFFEINKY